MKFICLHSDLIVRWGYTQDTIRWEWDIWMIHTIDMTHGSESKKKRRGVRRHSCIWGEKTPRCPELCSWRSLLWMARCIPTFRLLPHWRSPTKVAQTFLILPEDNFKLQIAFVVFLRGKLTLIELTFIVFALEQFREVGLQLPAEDWRGG